MADQSLTVTVEIGNGEGSFVGVKLEPGIKYRLVSKSNVCLINISQDPTTYRDRSNEVYERKDDWNECVHLIRDNSDCLLFFGNQEYAQHTTRWHVPEGGEITLYVKGKGTYYVCGYKTSVNYSID